MTTRTQSYSNAFYAFCEENSTETVIDGQKAKLWKGFIGRTCRKLEIPPGMEQRVIKPLEELGCLQMIRRGVGLYPSELILWYPPTEEVWNASGQGKPLTRRPSFAKLISDVDDLKFQLGGVNLPEALQNIENRLKALEATNPK